MLVGKFSLKVLSLNTVCGAKQDLPWRDIWAADNPVEGLNEELSLLVRRSVSMKVIHAHHKDTPCFDDQCKCAFDLKEEVIFCRRTIALGLTGKSLSPVE